MKWRSEHLVLLVSFALVAFYNGVFWHHLLRIVQPQDIGAWIFLGSVFFLLVAFFSLALLLLPFRWVVRPLLTALLPLSALASYFMWQYGVAIDGLMIQNVFETDVRESLELITWKLLLYFLVLGFSPVALVWYAPVPRLAWAAMFKARAISLVFSFFTISLIALVFYQSYATVMRNNRDLRFYLVPNNYIKGLMDYFKESSDLAPALAVLGVDATRLHVAGSRKKLFVLVIGETARAANFSLNGYARETNPELKSQEGLVSFTRFSSCGTDTAVSLPCMLSGLGRENYSLRKARSQENLLDVVKRSGVDVLWIDNQSGCKQTCDRLQRINTSTMKLSLYCPNGECHDEIMLEEMRKYVATINNDTLIVLHQMGSHGPAYYLRHPEKFRQFTPECRTELLDKCSKNEIVNSYDNTILYTDHFLSSLISELHGYEKEFDTGMLYMSDHGESLGEYGLYLHGAPYMLAPEFQTHVPAMLWLSRRFQEGSGISSSCLLQDRERPLSHDNLFHSVLGVFSIKTRVYQPALDIFAACRH